MAPGQHHHENSKEPSVTSDASTDFAGRWLGPQQRRRGPAAQNEGGAVYATVCLLGLKGLRVAEACAADIDDLTGTAYQPMLHIIGKGDRPAEIVLNPRTHQAIDASMDDRTHGPILVNAWGNRMRRHNVAAMLVRLAKTVDIDVRVRPIRPVLPPRPTFVHMSATAR